MTNVAVLIPWRGGCPHRQAALDWTLARLEAHHPDWLPFLGSCDDGPFNRAAAILEAAEQALSYQHFDVFVVMDGDVWCDGIDLALDTLDDHGWAIPHRLIHRLSPGSTTTVLAGGDWHGLPLSTDNSQDRRPYVGHPTGTIVALRSDVLAEVPPDRRFVGWGHEDDAWAYALHTLIGAPRRGTADLVHLWHPAQPRESRQVGSQAGLALFHRYKAARGKPAAMRALLDESRTLAAAR